MHQMRSCTLASFSERVVTVEISNVHEFYKCLFSKCICESYVAYQRLWFVN